MSSIKGVMLLPEDAASYRRHVAHHTFLARVNSGTRIRDPRQDLTRLVEDRVREAMRHSCEATPFRVLRWEQRTPDNRYLVKFRELDGVFRTEARTTVLLEVKASASASCLKSGLAQLRTSVRTAAQGQPNTVGLLVIADLGEWCELFGQAPVQPLADYFSGKDVELLDWPPRMPAGKTSGICVAVVPDPTMCEWLPPEWPEDGPLATTTVGGKDENWCAPSALAVALHASGLGHRRGAPAGAAFQAAFS
ncbi:hypothetical protein [Caldimonas tepidiphila]|uniref:hypothetical protein n=1 Tax=Caldimonas tepidiphila TaxID=2315841 RepID=UPI000E5BF865|nr:hypothetical protein [Caldimonas tepidiphila]